MSSNKKDIIVLVPGMLDATKTCNVAAAATTIYPGEPVARALGGVTVTQMATSKPVVATDYLEGIAASTSTQTASVAGTVQVVPLRPGVIYAAKPLDATQWNTQAKYDALVGKRVLLDLTTGTFTIGHTDGATYGCVIEARDINQPNDGMVYFSIRAGVSALA